jgi:hypothetical protein
MESTVASIDKARAEQREGSTAERRLADLRTTAASDPVLAQQGAWAWIVELGKRATRDRAGADAELNDLFRLGTAPEGLDGPTDGILVTPTMQPAVDRVLAALTTLWMPWEGKRFHSAESRGDNRMTGSARWVSKLLWPLYGMKPIEGGHAAFTFETRVEPGAADPDIDVLVIDYSVVDDNPRLVIKQIRDELVELVPHTYLGKILLTREGWPCIGYFALRQQA